MKKPILRTGSLLADLTLLIPSLVVSACEQPSMAWARAWAAQDFHPDAATATAWQDGEKSLAETTGTGAVSLNPLRDAMHRG